MEYTIRELADLSGVTTRTLRWYDQIGLLKPGRVAENGYRYYGPAQVDRLQDILYYRALGVELAQIKACLDDPSFDRLAALRGHLTALEQEQARLEALIACINRTNCCTLVDGVPLSDLLARRDCRKGKLGILRHFLDNASELVSRRTVGVIRIRSTVDVRSMQREVDRMSKELRELDEKIQEANWTTELLEG